MSDLDDKAQKRKEAIQRRNDSIKKVNQAGRGLKGMRAKMQAILDSCVPGDESKVATADELKELIELLLTIKQNCFSTIPTSHPRVFELIKGFYGRSFSEKLYSALNPGVRQQHLTCSWCSAKTDSYVTFAMGYREYCCGSCSSKGSIKKYGSKLSSETSKAKRKVTFIERYGTDSAITINRSKAVATTQARLGVDYPLQSPIIRQKVTDNLLAEHGVTNVYQLPKVIKQIKDTMTSRYGVAHALQVPTFFQKHQQTMLSRHGVTSALQSPEIMEKTRRTNLERYGTENPMQSVGPQENAKVTSLERYGADNPMKNADISKGAGRQRREESVKRGELTARIERLSKIYQVTPLFTVEDYIENKPMPWLHACGKTYVSDWHNGRLLVCPEPDCRKQSAPQRELYELVRSFFDDDVKIMVNTRAVITPYELDIYVPEKKMAIEMDGVYWHQDDYESKVDKQELCRQLGIRLLHITDLSWYANKDIWTSIIRSKLGLQERIFARRCTVEDIPNSEAKIFLDEHHLQGSAFHSHAIGLKHKGELVALMTFCKPRFNKGYRWELLRYVSKRGITVVGGAGKLLAHGRLTCTGSMITYAKKELGNGGLYRQLGFKQLSTGQKSYFYLKDEATISRFQAQKHKLSALLGAEFDSSLTEKENMFKAGYLLIPDKGSYTFVLEEF